MSFGYMILNVELSNNGFAELCGPNIKYYSGFGLPDFEGPLDGFALEFPAVMEELIKCGAVHR